MIARATADTIEELVERVGALQAGDRLEAAGHPDRASGWHGQPDRVIGRSAADDHRLQRAGGGADEVVRGVQARAHQGVREPQEQRPRREEHRPVEGGKPQADGPLSGAHRPRSGSPLARRGPPRPTSASPPACTRRGYSRGDRSCYHAANRVRRISWLGCRSDRGPAARRRNAYVCAVGLVLSPVLAMTVAACSAGSPVAVGRPPRDAVHDIGAVVRWGIRRAGHCDRWRSGPVGEDGVLRPVHAQPRHRRLPGPDVGTRWRRRLSAPGWSGERHRPELAEVPGRRQGLQAAAAQRGRPLPS